MRNIAKCLLCQSIIESVSHDDYISCSCDEIAVSGGDQLFCHAKNWSNFVRVDDKGNEISVKNLEEKDKLDFKDYLSMLDRYIKVIENLPEHVLDAPISHRDLVTALTLIQSIFKSQNLL